MTIFQLFLQFCLFKNYVLDCLGPDFAQFLKSKLEKNIFLIMLNSCKPQKTKIIYKSKRNLEKKICISLMSCISQCSPMDNLVTKR